MGWNAYYNSWSSEAATNRNVYHFSVHDDITGASFNVEILIPHILTSAYFEFTDYARAAVLSGFDRYTDLSDVQRYVTAQINYFMGIQR